MNKTRLLRKARFIYNTDNENINNYRQGEDIMKRIIAVCALIIMLIPILTACADREGQNTDNADNQDIFGNGEDAGTVNDNTDEYGAGYEIPQELETIPEEYTSAADEQGTLVELYYDTYESRSYEQKTQKLEKRAIVYLPYGYSENNRYNVFYLMHGGWSDETAILGTPDQPSSFKNVVDNAIENGEFDPLIIVCPTYNNESSQDSWDYTLAFNTLTVNYHNELVNDLIPAVEGTY